MKSSNQQLIAAEDYVNRQHAPRKPMSLRELLQMRAEIGLQTPLEVMLTTMDKLVEQAAEHYGEGRRGLAMEAYKEAVEVARSAAPYIHPKLSAMTISNDDEKPILKIEITTADDLRRLVRGGGE